MADINSEPDLTTRRQADQRARRSVKEDGREAQFREAMEMLYFSYRAFTGVADPLLETYGFGRAHHRVLYFVGRHPGILVKELLDTLEITKQSLARVLRALVDQGLVEQRPGAADKRNRHLRLSAAGQTLEARVAAAQMTLLQQAFAGAGPHAVDGFRAVLLGLIDPSQQGRFNLS